MCVKGKKRLHLVCNAHMDPVWLWEWEEGAAAAIATFRTAADLLDEFTGFVFNHNEAILYRWVEEYEPELFRRIQGLVRAGNWHIMGGWFLQPDCNMPSGESLVRQILVGKSYFREKFGVEPTTAINFDPFGHSRGLAQILAKAGYDSYLFCRPDSTFCTLPAENFWWEGYDGSTVLASRVESFYNSPLGGARRKVETWMAEHPSEEVGIVLWGVGNHGGGPSKIDLEQLSALMQEVRETEIVHSTPEAYFRELRTRAESFSVRRRDINPWGVGCYTSMARIKQRHRRLENELFMVEKMATTAAAQGLLPYPEEELRDALLDLLTSEFHDILPGSSIQPVEEASLRLMDHGLEILSRVKARTFFALAKGQPKAAEGEIPVLVYNPHPFPVRETVECEFQLADINWDQTLFTEIEVLHQGRPLAAQVEKELSNLSIDWRKRVVFTVELAPSQMNRFDCRPKLVPAKAREQLRERDGKLVFTTPAMEVTINTRTGLIDRWRVGEVDYLQKGAFRALVIDDNEDPWGMRVRRFRDVVGKFALMSGAQAAQFAGVRQKTLKPVRVVEDGPVRTVVEACFAYGSSAICQRYKLPKQGSEIEVELRVYWGETNRMLKLSIPTPFAQGRFLGQVVYGMDELPANGDEVVAQKWLAVVDEQNRRALTCVNEGTYGADYWRGELRLSLLRAPAYSGHPIEERPIVPQDRFTPRIDQGERLFRFWLTAGSASQRLMAIHREALVKNERPYALSFFPPGEGKLPGPGVRVDGPAVLVTAIKKAEQGDGLIIRLFEPTGQARTTRVELPWVPLAADVHLRPFEVKTLLFRPEARRLVEVDLLEREIVRP
ncbi:MAG: glycoside hydrolase family 38 C-terminal domain-containing protein [bacterium]|jgi:alpha-mannosidase|nr:alpha-mannosidase [candidate division KSB1 bacterium]MDH7559266.1 glycoside hydrolase family 38 C-terminal domain-containing protein [bacterium]